MNTCCKQHHCAKQAFRYKAEQHHRAITPSTTIGQKQQILQAAPSCKTSFPIQSRAAPSWKSNKYYNQHHREKATNTERITIMQDKLSDTKQSSTLVQKQQILQAASLCKTSFPIQSRAVQSCKTTKQHNHAKATNTASSTIVQNKLSDTKYSNTIVQNRRILQAAQ